MNTNNENTTRKIKKETNVFWLNIKLKACMYIVFKSGLYSTGTNHAFYFDDFNSSSTNVQKKKKKRKKKGSRSKQIRKRDQL